MQPSSDRIDCWQPTHKLMWGTKCAGKNTSQITLLIAISSGNPQREPLASPQPGSRHARSRSEPAWSEQEELLLQWQMPQCMNQEEVLPLEVPDSRSREELATVREAKMAVSRRMFVEHTRTRIQHLHSVFCCRKSRKSVPASRGWSNEEWPGKGDVYKWKADIAANCAS